MLIDKIKDVIKKTEFIHVCTCDHSGIPNAAPKFFLKLENKVIYLVDYTLGKTYENLQINKRVSLSFMNFETLMAYRVNGMAEVIGAGSEYESIVNELHKKEVELSVTRILEGLREEKKHTSFEIALPQKIIILKVPIEEITEFGIEGELQKENFSPHSSY